MPNPTLNPFILLAPDGEGFVAYDPAADLLHTLNPVAALLADLCDGSRGVRELEEMVAPLLPQNAGPAVAGWLRQAAASGLLVEQAPHYSARERARMELRTALFCARRLDDRAPAEALYAKAREAVVTDPEDWDSWQAMGKIAQLLGRRDEARAAYRRYLQGHPENGEVAQILVALADAPPPVRASDQAVRQIYSRFAASYDTRMRDELRYAGPERLWSAVENVIGSRAGLRVLDLGCGSGLMGACSKARAAELVGIDLSPEMIALARARGIYDRLEVAEITAWLGASSDDFDLILCCDSLIYFGDLTPLVRAAASRLARGGIFAVSMERGAQDPFLLSPDTGRYSHHPRHLRAAANAAALQVEALAEGFLRLEYGQEVTGMYAVLAVSPASE
jgi:predicted TPR repeat methyltransferase